LRCKNLPGKPGTLATKLPMVTSGKRKEECIGGGMKWHPIIKVK
jgi:hypothetical protein